MPGVGIQTSRDGPRDFGVTIRQPMPAASRDSDWRNVSARPHADAFPTNAQGGTTLATHRKNRGSKRRSPSRSRSSMPPKPESQRRIHAAEADADSDPIVCIVDDAPRIFANAEKGNVNSQIPLGHMRLRGSGTPTMRRPPLVPSGCRPGNAEAQLAAMEALEASWTPNPAPAAWT